MIADGAGARMPGVTPFVDRDLWSRTLDATLRETGIRFVAHRDRFAHDTPDAQWLAAAAEHGWVIVTRDQRIRYRANEAAAVRRGRLHLFALSSGHLSAAESAQIVVAAWPRIRAAARDHAPPMLWTNDRSGRIRPAGG